jgi:hypothetical protein
MLNILFTQVKIFGQNYEYLYSHPWTVEIIQLTVHFLGFMELKLCNHKIPVKIW